MRIRTTRTPTRSARPHARRPHARALASVALATTIGLAGCATVPGANSAKFNDPRDPWESFNRRSLAFNDALDRAILKPVAQTYNKLPQPVRSAISNAFSNLGEVVVVANDLLQLKLRQGAQDTARFVMNSTFGLLGTVDFVGKRGLPKHDEDFGQTLGYWGVPPGPYIVIPFLGPSDLRDGIARFADYRLTIYPQLNDTSVYWSLYAVDVVHTRADLLGATNVLETAALDRYNFLRDAFLQRRLNQVYDGHPPKRQDDEDDGDADTPAPKAGSGGDEPPSPPKFNDDGKTPDASSSPAPKGNADEMPTSTPRFKEDGAATPNPARGTSVAQAGEGDIGETRISQASDIEMPAAGGLQDIPATDVEVPGSEPNPAMQPPQERGDASGGAGGEIESPAVVAPLPAGAPGTDATSLEGKF